MIILDTNVLSELMKPQGSDTVRDWIDGVRREHLFTTSISCAEIFYGLAAMDEGRRRDSLSAAAEALFGQDFAGRILPFDSRAARHFARIAAHRRQAGTRIEDFDGQIAAIALANTMSLATRNVTHFEDCGVDLINPWEP